jgi:hypothetical protein
MAAIKSYTDLNQSKKLADILSIESADMYYSDVPVREWVDKTDISKGTHVIFKSQIFAIENLRNHEIGEDEVYAWSLAALLGVLPILERKGYQKAMPQLLYNVAINKWIVDSHVYTTDAYDNPVDACVAMIEKLHELKIL